VRMRLLILLTTLGCAQQRFPMRWIDVGGHRIRVEVADDGARRSQGLMNRDYLAPDEGMLFVYPEERMRSFWMKNTRIPLSIAYLSASGEIVSIHDMKPMSLRGTPSAGPAMYALEMNQGWFQAKGVEVGARVGDLPGAAAQ
jgi:uncharacterized membrane protein (UPF0127 family)